MVMLGMEMLVSKWKPEILPKIWSRPKMMLMSGELSNHTGGIRNSQALNNLSSSLNLIFTCAVKLYLVPSA